MERTKGISQAEKVVLRFNRIPRLGIQISLRKPNAHAPIKQATQIKNSEKQQVSEMFRFEAYRLTRNPL